MRTSASNIEDPYLDDQAEAYRLFSEIAKRRGLADARRIFMIFARPPTARKLNRIKNCSLLDFHDFMKPKPNVAKLARQLAEENKMLPKKERHGPRGSTDPATLDKHIRRLLAEREASLKKGTWWGPKGGY